MDGSRDDGVRELCERASSPVVWWHGRMPVWSAVYRLTRGRIDKRPRYNTTQLPTLDSPWQDTPSGRCFGWRCRQANHDSEQAFVVEYVVCPHCRLGWVDKPYTIEAYHRRGLAAAGLTALRGEHPDVAWHTGSGHLRDSRTFWATVGQDVPGSYQPKDLCPHVQRQGGLKEDWQSKRQQ